MRTLRQKLVLATVLVFSLTTLAILLATRVVIVDAMSQQSSRDSARSAALLSSALGPLLAQRDLAGLDELSHDLVQRGDFTFLEVRDSNQQLLSQAGSTSASAASLSETTLRVGQRNYGVARFSLDRGGIEAATDQILGRMLAICLGTMVLAALLLVYWSGVLTRSLTALRNGADRMAAGEQDVRIAATGKDELAKLATAFNHMSEVLSERFTALESAEKRLQESHAVLEHRVSERTQHLEQTLDRLQLTQDELVEAKKLASLGALVAGISHELNTPIGNALLTASSLQSLLRETDTSVQNQTASRKGLIAALGTGQEMAGLVVKSSQKAAELITSFKRVAVDDASQQRRRFDLLSIVSDLMRAMSYGLKHSAHAIELDIPTGVVMDSYPGPLDQVISNLIQNAERHAFGPNSTGLLRISATLVAGGQRVELRVQDNGAGMPANVLEHVFDPFFTTKMGQGGSGLGLSIVRNIVHGLLGGHISVTSTVGQGSTFVLDLPLLAPLVADSVASTYAPL
ncbi:sensor histidine kinase [Rhodoferax aquaticus]|nr:HAMP domain-containing sensor histidine kinase [Rhodoferax aquaticus]